MNMPYTHDLGVQAAGVTICGVAMAYIVAPWVGCMFCALGGALWGGHFLVLMEHVWGRKA